MDKMFELYKDGQFLGERPKTEIEQLAKSNEEFGYHLLIYDGGGNDTGIAILEKDPKRLKRAETIIASASKAIQKFKDSKQHSQTALEGLRTLIIQIITGRL